MGALRVGFVGWRGMVGSVLLERMRAEGDFAGIEPTFFSTSNPGGQGPAEADGAPLQDAHDVAALKACDVVVTCQGGDYTKAVYPQLMQSGFEGVWIDASSALRMDDDCMLVLDPVNGQGLREALHAGRRLFAGANCTVSLLILGLHGLLAADAVEWIATASYQAASGAGARNLKELVAQMHAIGQVWDPARAALDIDRDVGRVLDGGCPTEAFGAPLAGSVLPWIDRLMPSGQTREEWKAQAEAARILGRTVPIDGVCVRVGALRSHAQAVTIKLRRDLPLDEVEGLLHQSHPWVDLIPNDKDVTLQKLTPAAVSGTLQVPVGRVRPMTLGAGFVSAFTVGDQLLWGAAEPLRRMLAIVREVREL